MKTVTVNPSRSVLENEQWYVEGQSFECADPSIHGDAVTVNVIDKIAEPASEGTVPAPKSRRGTRESSTTETQE